MKKKILTKIACITAAFILAALPAGQSQCAAAATAADQLTAASGLSQKEISYYRSVITKQKYVDDTDHAIYGDGQFFLYDLNQDGRQDLIVTGALGLRSATCSIVYYYDGTKFGHTDVIAGTPTGVSKKCLEFVSDDYEQAGLIRYTMKTTYKLTKKFRMVELTKYSDRKSYDESTEDYSYNYKHYTYKGDKISKTEYTSRVKAYQLKKITLNDNSSANAKKLIQ